jgi:transcriptional regulator with XRE-family HTH domain
MAKRVPDRQTDHGAPGAALQILFGENFRAARLKAGLSQGDVVALSDIKQQSISQIEAGHHNLTLKTMDKLAKAVDRDVVYLLRMKRLTSAPATRKAKK